ncbi:MAG TPA: choice-of-anchor B family protein, partial [Thermoanaerobaculia bacterium]|nr:choice-of-anchor B family protein [Thermoanaerobaculia bacterium]
MNCFPKETRRAAVIGLIAVALLFTGSPARAHDETPGSVERHLHGLVDGGAITQDQHEKIEEFVAAGRLSRLRKWLVAQEKSGQLSKDMRLYISALLGLSPPVTAQAAVPANYIGNGNVTKLGQLNPQPPSPYYGDNSSTGLLYNGMWGYAAGSREYALQSNSFGLHIIDVTDPAAPFRVQYIDMSGGVNPPKGRIWRDADTHYDPVSGKTYAYVGAQSNGNLWVVDLSYLSDSAPQGVNSNPIPPAGIADRGRTNYGHTVFVNDGLLFVNTANNGATLGCQIFDLLQNPFDPPLLAGWTGAGHDCHDSVARTNVPGSGGKNLLYSSDGYATRHRILDITNVRSGGTPTLLGETAPVAGIYAHSGWLTDDSHYLYTFDEFNVYDTGIYDVSNPASPTQVTTFQWSGDDTANSRMHNGQIRGNYLLSAYYQAGLRVFDISNPANPVEVGKYETWRDPDGDG